jgi:hypothetical protein
MTLSKIELRINQAVALSLALLLTSLPSLAAQGTRSGGGNVGIKSKPVRVEPLVEILNYGLVRELNSENGGDQYLRLRLYEVPREGGCVTDTHVVCSL